MVKLFRYLVISCLPLAAVACSVQAPPGIVSKSPDNKTRQLIRERLSAVVVTESKNFSSWSHQKFAIEKAPKDADGGSAAPIAEDGYFLTADHVLAEADAKSVYVIYANGGKAVARSARILWRSAKDDLALLHVPISTPYYYQWSDPRLGIPKGYPVIHGGMSTGSRSAPGVVRTALSPENFLTGHRAFKMDIPLEPGDSGGPVVDAYGRLVGVNSAVEFLVPMETAIFMDSEGIRPNTRKIQFIIDSDRHSRQSH